MASSTNEFPFDDPRVKIISAKLVSVRPVSPDHSPLTDHSSTTNHSPSPDESPIDHRVNIISVKWVPEGPKSLDHISATSLGSATDDSSATKNNNLNMNMVYNVLVELVAGFGGLIASMKDIKATSDEEKEKEKALAHWLAGGSVALLILCVVGIGLRQKRFIRSAEFLSHCLKLWAFIIVIMIAVKWF
ncbi:uncharacterized protein [Rutidosis leptorrhynchoides]|uniref:uncharacterized protein n=1 Tax=Rutidosis leptorrhynchoides TaxID=125765 RepID=UPI003A992484